MSPNYDDIVDNIKAIISKKRMEQTTVAVHAGFTPQEFSDMLNERRKLIRIEFIPMIAEALDVGIEYLFFYGEIQKELAKEGIINCPHCNGQVQKEDNYCMYCGSVSCIDNRFDSISLRLAQ